MVSGLLKNILSELLFFVVALAPLFIIFTHLRERYKHATRDMYQTSEAFIGTLEFGTGYRIVSANNEGLSLWKLKGRTPVLVYQLLWQNLVLEKTMMSIARARTGEGLRLRDKNTGLTIRVAIYRITSHMFSGPIKGPELDAIISRWQQKQPVF